MSNTPTDPPKTLEQILDAHAEYYIRQTMKFFQNEGKSPALSKNNEGDLSALAEIQALIEREVVPDRKAKSSLGYPNAEKLEAWKDGYNKARDDFRLSLSKLIGEEASDA